MLHKFQTFGIDNHLFTPEDKILLAVSGGIDSVVMLDLFSKTNNTIALIHCNFGLRGKESDEDEEFVKQLAKEYQMPIFSKLFSTQQYAEKYKLSIQMAARELRYRWFEEIRKKNGYTCIATAHNKNDIIETFFINMARGTGIKGLTGIKEKTGSLIRPLLFATRQDISQYCIDNQLTFREDSSNKLTKYKRNKIRHNIIPSFQELNPDFIDTMYANILRLKDAEKIYRERIDKYTRQITKFVDDKSYISINDLKEHNHTLTVLHEILHPYGFSNDIIVSVNESLYSQPGKEFLSSTHRLVRDRKNLIITKKKEEAESSLEIYEDDEIILYPIKLKIEFYENAQDFTIPSDNKTACIDLQKLKYPLILRKWKKGDYFYPLGMQHRKKLSDFFIDQKIPLHEKEDIWILEANNEIIWIIGYRLDNRYKITSETKDFIMIKL